MDYPYTKPKVNHRKPHLACDGNDPDTNDDAHNDNSKTDVPLNDDNSCAFDDNCHNLENIFTLEANVQLHQTVLHTVTTLDNDLINLPPINNTLCPALPLVPLYGTCSCNTIYSVITPPPPYNTTLPHKHLPVNGLVVHPAPTSTVPLGLISKAPDPYTDKHLNLQQKPCSSHCFMTAFLLFAEQHYWLP